MGFLNTLFGGKRERSSDVARERLLKVLVDDRIKLTPDMLAQMKAELSAVVAKYVPNGVEPDQIDRTAYAQLLPAIMSPVSAQPVTTSVDFGRVRKDDTPILYFG